MLYSLNTGWVSGMRIHCVTLMYFVSVRVLIAWCIISICKWRFWLWMMVGFGITMESLLKNHTNGLPSLHPHNTSIYLPSTPLSSIVQHVKLIYHAPIFNSRNHIRFRLTDSLFKHTAIASTAFLSIANTEDSPGFQNCSEIHKERAATSPLHGNEPHASI